MKAIYEAYPEPAELQVASLNLRYLDAFELEPNQNMFDFLSGQLKSRVSLPSQLFEHTGVSSGPKTLNVMASFATEMPRGDILVRFGSGRHKDKPALIMETAVQSRTVDLPKMPENFEEWLEAAHKLTDDWFFKFIEGELYRSVFGKHKGTH